MKVVNLTKKFNERTILKSINYEFKTSGLYFIIGDSGCGKSTFLNMLSGIDLSYSGDIFFKNINLKKMNSIKEFRINHFGYIFQSFNLFENDTVYNNLNLLKGNSIKNKEVNEKEIEMILHSLGVKNLKNKLVKNLSGGEKQRVCIARALLNNPDVIFADEPTGSLDSKNSENIFKILKELSEDRLIICVSHDKENAFKYGDYILEIQDETIKEVKSKNIIKKQKIKELKKDKNKRKISLNFIFNHFKSLFKEKRLSCSISNIFLTFAFLTFGLSILVRSNISNNLKKSFQDILGNQSLVLSRKNNDPLIKDYQGATFEEIKEIKKQYEDEIDYVGVNYIVDFENFYKDKNEFYDVTKPIKKKIEGFSIRHFNEFEYIKSLENIGLNIGSDILKNDEIVLGLNYPQLKNICLNLSIKRDYATINEYLKTNDLLVSLFLANSNWNYEDEQIFKVKGVIMSNKSMIYHTNPLFNEIVFEENMRFPSTVDINKSFDEPWMMKKIYYIKLKKEQCFFLNKIMYDSKFKEYLFDNDNNLYSPLNFKENNNKFYVYSVVGNFIDFNVLNVISENFNIGNNFYFSTNGGYKNSGTEMLSGFVNSTFLSSDKDKLESFLDDFSKYDNNKNEIAIGDEFIYGNMLNFSGNNLKFTTIKSNLIEGNNPGNIHEIGISSSIKKKFDIKINDEIYIGLTSINNDKNYLKNGFKIIKLKISGIYESDNFFIYHDSNFSISLFRDLFKVSCFNLIVDSIVFESENVYTNEEINKLNSLFYEYKFDNILNDLESSLNETLNILSVILLVFSFLLMLFSIIIIIVINSINLDESKKDIRIFNILGFSNKEIFKVYFLENLFLILMAQISSSIGLIVSQLMINKIIENQLNTAIKFTLPFMSVLFTIVIGSIVLIIISPFIYKTIKKLNF